MGGILLVFPPRSYTSDPVNPRIRTDGGLHLMLATSWYSSATSVTSAMAPACAVHCREQAEALARAGHWVAVLALPEIRSRSLPASLWTLVRPALAPPRVEPEGALAILRCGGVLPRAWPRLCRWWSVRQGLRAFELYVRQRGVPDVLHAHAALYAGELAARIQEVYHVPVVLIEPAEVPRERLESIYRELAFPAERQSPGSLQGL